MLLTSLFIQTNKRKRLKVGKKNLINKPVVVEPTDDLKSQED